MNCGEKIADLRKKRGMTQDELGKAMNVSYQAVSKWERDESQPDFETMTKIANLFGVPLGYFADGGEQTEIKEEQPKTENDLGNIIGTCTVCGKIVKNGEEATSSPKVVCKECAEREAEEQRKNEARKAEEVRHTRETLLRDALGHGFDAPLIVSIVLTLAAYIGFFVLTLLNIKTDDAFLYGALLFFCPLAVFGCTHAVSDIIADFKDKDDDGDYTRNLSLIVGACFALVNAALFLVLYLLDSSSGNFYYLILLFAGAILAFTFVSQFLWGGSVKEIFTAGGFTFKLPGFIITLSIDSILWMIVVKFFLGILAAIVFIVTTVLFAAVAILGSVFLFIPSVLMKTAKDSKARHDLK